MSSEIKPCPFCGGEAAVECSGGAFAIVCRSCGCRTATRTKGWKPSYEEAAEAWNRRSNDGD